MPSGRSKYMDKDWKLNGTHQLLVYPDGVDILGEIMNTTMRNQKVP
jgi:hypothetical protein